MKKPGASSKSWFGLEVDGAFICIDVEATKSAYNDHDPQQYTSCDCDNCMNLAAQRESFPSSGIRQWLSLLGVNPSHPTDVTHYAPVDGGHLYMMLYHIKGKFDADSSSSAFWTNRTVTQLIDGCRVTITDKIGPPPESCFNFEPMLQIEVEITVPWVLDSPEPA